MFNVRGGVCRNQDSKRVRGRRRASVDISETWRDLRQGPGHQSQKPEAHHASENQQRRASKAPASNKEEGKNWPVFAQGLTKYRPANPDWGMACEFDPGLRFEVAGKDRDDPNGWAAQIGPNIGPKRERARPRSSRQPQALLSLNNGARPHPNKKTDMC